MWQLTAFILNIPWTILGVIAAILSIPVKVKFVTRPLAVVVDVRSFWWYKWLPGKKGVRACAIGNAILLETSVRGKDLSHELVHVEQHQRIPLLQPLLYIIESLTKGYRNNKYEKEAYKRSGSKFIND